MFGIGRPGRGIAVIAATVLLGIQPVRAGVLELPAGGEPRVDMFLQAFLQMTLWPSNTFNQIEQPRPAIDKLAQTIKVRMDASGYEDWIRDLLRQEGATTGLEIVILDRNDKSEDVFIEIHHYTDATAPMWKNCNTLVDVGEQGQKRVHVHADPLGIVRNIKRNTAGFYGCFNRETLHALGLNYDHDHASVMSDRYSHWYLTPIDKMSVGTLYDARIKQGMHWMAAMASAREAIVQRMIKEGAPSDTANMGRRWVTELAGYMKQQAEGGNTFFQTQLGFAYAYGEATEYLPEDAAAGYQWFRRAAEAGDVEAQAQVGEMLVNGRGVEANRAEGMRWLRRAANSGHAEALRTLDSLDDTRLRIIERPPSAR
jgi:hypothetical protein